MTITKKLGEHLIRCEQAVQSAKPTIGKHEYPDDYRTSTVIGFISVLIEHQESALLLIMHDKVGSAFALGRPIVEGAYRGLWINGCATDEQIKKFNEDDRIDLTFGEIAAALDPAHNTVSVRATHLFDRKSLCLSRMDERRTAGSGTEATDTS